MPAEKEKQPQAQRPGRPQRALRPIPDPVKPEILLEREQRRRVPAIALAVTAGILPLAASLVAALAAGTYPTGKNKEAESIRYVADNDTALLVSAILQVLGILAVAGAILYLYDATRGRRPQTPQFARMLMILGPVALAIGAIGFQLSLSSHAHDFVSAANQSDKAAKDLLKGGSIATFAYLRSISVLLIMVGFALTALNAMRAGLLTRFLGTLGIIVAVLPILSVIVPFAAGVPLVQTFWFVALALLIAGRWPNGTPPAWVTGEEQPWPSQQEMRERAMAQRAGSDGEKPKPAPAAEDQRDGDGDGDGAPPRPVPAKRKRKRKR